MKDLRYIKDLFARYAVIILAGLGNLYIFYKILTPLTVETLNILFKTFGENPLVVSNVIFLKTVTLELIPACIAGSAFYLLLILNFATPNLGLSKRLKILLESFIILFILNIIRILFLVSIWDQIYFETIHLIFWHFVSTIFVVGIWVHLLKKYNIREIAIYTDMLYLINSIKARKNSKRHKKN